MDLPKTVYTVNSEVIISIFCLGFYCAHSQIHYNKVRITKDTVKNLSTFLEIETEPIYEALKLIDPIITKYESQN